jgi:hypothetical protein
MALAGAASLVLAGCGSVQRIADGWADASDAELMSAVSLTEQDMAPGSIVDPYPGGDEVFGETSLDLCYADFPSEELRSGRTQVVAVNPEGAAWVSSEAILYPTPEDAQQAMDELRSAQSSCPDEPVEPPSGDGDPLTWKFRAQPDGQWPDQPGVRRQAYRFSITDRTDNSWSSTATYLQRGRMVLALYATPANSPARVLRNSPDQARFVEVMSQRLAGLPEQALEYGEALEDPNDLSV